MSVYSFVLNASFNANVTNKISVLKLNFLKSKCYRIMLNVFGEPWWCAHNLW